MTELVVIFVLCFSASLLDWLISFLRLPQLVILARPSQVEPSEEETSSDVDGLKDPRDVKVFLFALHNEERVVVERSAEPIQVILETEGDHGFLAGESYPEGFKAFLGPDPEVRGEWIVPGRRLRLIASRIRPLKTFVFKCYVDSRVYRMRMTLLVPFSGVVRRFFGRVSTHIFGFTEVEQRKVSITVDTEEVRKATKGMVTQSLGFIVPTFLLSASLYLIFWTTTLWPLLQSYPLLLGHEELPIHMHEGSWLLDLPLVLAGIFALGWLTQRRGYGMAQGYHYPSRVEIRMPPTREEIRYVRMLHEDKSPHRDPNSRWYEGE